MTTIYKLPQIATMFERFAELECNGKSALYYQLAHHIAKDQWMLQLCHECRTRQPIPNLLLGAVHYLLLSDKEEELAQYYPTISGKKTEEIPYDIFRAYCLRKEFEIKAILKSRIVQTNVVNRTSYLMPIISSQYTATDTLTVIDIGTSSGLALNYDRYKYSYNNNQSFGQGDVEIKCEISHGSLPNFKQIKRASRKIGIDQHVLDVRSSENSLWLKGLIWPDMLEQFTQISSAIDEFQKTQNISLLEASSLPSFQAIINSIPTNEKLFIYHTHVLYQFSSEERFAFRAMLHELGKTRNLDYLAVEGGKVFDNSFYAEKEVIIELTCFQDGQAKSKVMGYADAHGKWVKCITH